MIKRIFSTIWLTLICKRCNVQSDWINGICPNCGYTEGSFDE